MKRQGWLVLISSQMEDAIPTRKMFLRFFKRNPDLAPTGTPNVFDQCQWKLERQCPLLDYKARTKA